MLANTGKMIKEIQVKSVLNKKKKRDDWFLDEYTVNPYEGCSFNCQYCYIRGSKYGENMADGLAVKINALEILDRQLAFRAKKKQHGIVALASATDPYIGSDDRYQLTQGFLKLFLKHRFPVLMLTKSDKIVNDLPLLKQIDEAAILPEDLKSKLSRGVIISFSFSTMDGAIARRLEPGAPSPQERLRALAVCKRHGFLVGVNCIPALPFISDTDEQLDKMVSAAKEYGADYILVGGLTLFGQGPADSRTLYHRFLEREFPHLMDRYKSLYRMHPFPEKDYLNQLSVRANSLCEKYRIANNILDACA